MNNEEAIKLINELKNKNLLKSENYLNRKKDIQSRLLFGSYDSIKDAAVTIVIPAYRRPDLFERALKSAINQEGEIPYKILITDDSEELASQNEEIVKRLGDSRIIYYKNDRALGWYNWNRLLELADTPWICMLHDDDILYRKHLFYMNETLKKCKQPTMLTCERIFFKNEDAVLSMNEGSIKDINSKELKLKHINFQFASFMLGAFINREKAIEIGGFNDGIISLDYEFIARMIVAGRVYVNPLTTYGYGVKNNESTKSDMWEKMLISEYYICRSICNYRNIFLRCLAKKVEDYSIANHIQDMSSPARNIYGVELDFERICEWLGINYNDKGNIYMRVFRKILT